MTKRLVFITIFGLFILIYAASLTGMSLFTGQAQGQKDIAAFRENQCVNCHSGLTEPVYQVNRYLEWHFSKHHDKGVSCDKCHGGDPAARNKNAAHKGVLKSSDRNSRLFTWNQPDTCRSCHQGVTNAFTQSNHYIKLKGAGLGPSCNTCHIHMASKVLYSPDEVSSHCANCHNTVNGLLMPRPDIPETAKDNVMAFQRVDFVTEWSGLLLAEAQRRGLNVSEEKRNLDESEALLTSAKMQWHTFYMGNVRKQADDAFLKAVKARDSLRRKLSR